MFNAELQTDLNLPFGPKPLFFVKYKNSYLTSLQHVFETVGLGKHAIIIVDPYIVLYLIT